MTLESRASMAEMFAMRQSGASIEDIAKTAGLKFGTTYQRLRRQFGAEAIKRENATGGMPGPANDNNPDRVARMTPRNGGCSTTSGMMPVTVRRLVAAEPVVDEDEQAGAVVNEYALQQVAA